MNSVTGYDETYRIELIRKAIHLCSLSIPTLYYLTSRETALLVLIPVTVFFIAIDISRYYHAAMEGWFYKTWGKLLRTHEVDKRTKRLNGATFVLISATICVIIFPKVIMLTSFSILIICDMAAALFGRRFGRHKFFKKSLEGSLAFLLSGIVVVLLTPKIEYLTNEYIIGFIAAAVGALVEALSIQIDDNLSIPLTVGASLWAMYYLFLPMIDLLKFS